MNRRKFIKQGAMAGLAFSAVPAIANINPFDEEFPVHQITDGDKQHWFGYYDKWQLDTSGRYALGNQVDLFYRSPTPDDVLRIGLIDLENNFKWKEIGQSTAWGWQQGCMLQWIPGSTEEIIWNDREGDRFVSRVLNVHTGAQRTLPRPIYALSPDGRFAVGADFRRIQNMRPGYGYPGLEDPYRDVRAPEEIDVRLQDLVDAHQLDGDVRRGVRGRTDVDGHLALPTQVLIAAVDAVEASNPEIICQDGALCSVDAREASNPTTSAPGSCACTKKGSSGITMP